MRARLVWGGGCGAMIQRIPIQTGVIPGNNIENRVKEIMLTGGTMPCPWATTDRTPFPAGVEEYPNSVETTIITWSDYFRYGATYARASQERARAEAYGKIGYSCRSDILR